MDALSSLIIVSDFAIVVQAIIELNVAGVISDAEAMARLKKRHAEYAEKKKIHDDDEGSDVED